MRASDSDITIQAWPRRSHRLTRPRFLPLPSLLPQGSSGQICVWDLLSLSLSASLQLDCRAISLDSSGARVAAVVRPPVSKARAPPCSVAEAKVQAARVIEDRFRFVRLQTSRLACLFCALISYPRHPPPLPPARARRSGVTTTPSCSSPCRPCGSAPRGCSTPRPRLPPSSRRPQVRRSSPTRTRTPSGRVSGGVTVSCLQCYACFSRDK